MSDSDDPKSNLIAFKREKRTGSLEPVRAGYNACKHKSATVDEETRSVKCAECKASLDAFDVLFELANKQRRWLDELDAWDAYRDSKLGERYDIEWERAKDHISNPPQDAPTRQVWDAFHQYLGDKFVGMHRRKTRKRSGPEWYGRTIHGAIYSYEFARGQVKPKITATVDPVRYTKVWS